MACPAGTLLPHFISALEQSKTQFLNLASHELRGPITVIRGYLSMAEAGTLGKMSSELNQILPLLISRADEMNALVEQMIEAARLEEGRLELRPAKADMRDIAKRALQTCGQIFRYAIAFGYVQHNPASAINARSSSQPSPRRGQKTVSALRTGIFTSQIRALCFPRRHSIGSTPRGVVLVL